MIEELKEYAHIISKYSETKESAKKILAQSIMILRSIPMKDAKEISFKLIENAWQGRKKTDKYSLRKKTMKELKILMNLLDAEKGIRFKEVYIPLKRDITSNNLPREMYNLFIKDHSPQKESLRGGYVKFMETSKDGLIIWCENDFYSFLIHDIDRARSLKFDF
jgi:hypothetical protein